MGKSKVKKEKKHKKHKKEKKKKKEKVVFIENSSSSSPVQSSEVEVRSAEEKKREELGLTVSIESNTSIGLGNVPGPYPRSITEQSTSNGKSNYNTFLSDAFNYRFRKNKYQPSPIQLQTWSLLREASFTTSQNHQFLDNVIAIAPTSSGKTIAYGLPLLYAAYHHPQELRGLYEKKNQHNPVNNIRGLVLVPTRELAIQVAVELNKCISSKQKNPVMAIYGGQSLTKKEQLDTLNNKNGDNTNIHILVATPGRLLDLLSNIDDSKRMESNAYLNDAIEESAQNYLQLPNVRFIVLDEADRMLCQMGMSDQVKSIFSLIYPTKNPSNEILHNLKHDMIEKSIKYPRKITWLFSATYPSTLQTACTSTLDMPLDRLVIRYNTLQVKFISKHHQRKDKEENLQQISSVCREKNETINETKLISNSDNLKENIQQINNDNEDSKDVIGEDVKCNKKKDNQVAYQKYGTEEESNTNQSVIHHDKAQLDDDTINLKTTDSTIELASIPSHVIQILHVCSAHKKPRKLITTLTKHKSNIEKNRNKVGCNSSRQNQLTIIFFKTIKTLRYIFKLLQGEGTFQYLKLFFKIVSYYSLLMKMKFLVYDL